jgi:hypothetical protein
MLSAKRSRLAVDTAADQHPNQHSSTDQTRPGYARKEFATAHVPSSVLYLIGGSAARIRLVRELTSTFSA